MSYIRTYSDKMFDYSNINPNQIDINDIAQALSQIPRWLGHTDKLYSVAQHCCWCYDNTDGNKLEALMHDATEAYVSDIPSPLKALLPDYKNIENKVATQIALKFRFNYPYSHNTHIVDKQALYFERTNVKKLDNDYIPLDKNISKFCNIKHWSSKKAKKEFLKRFNNEL